MGITFVHLYFLTNIYQLCPILIVITIILMGTHQYPRVYPPRVWVFWRVWVRVSCLVPQGIPMPMPNCGCKEAREDAGDRYQHVAVHLHMGCVVWCGCSSQAER